MPSTTNATYKPVSAVDGNHTNAANGSSWSAASTTNVEGRSASKRDLVMFTIDDDEEEDTNVDDGVHHHRNFHPISTFEMDHDDNDNDENDNAPLEDISNNSFSEDDLSEQLFGWKDPWLPSIAITIVLSTPVLCGTALLLYNVSGVAFLATPFMMHWMLLVAVARHVVSTKPRLLQNMGSRIVTSVVSLYVRHLQTSVLLLLLLLSLSL